MVNKNIKYRSKLDFKTNKERKAYKKLLFDLQNGKCFYCLKNCYIMNSKFREDGKPANGRGLFTFDHFIPVIRGGSIDKLNLVGSCKICNHHKADLLFEEFKETIYYKKVMQKSKLINN